MGSIAISPATSGTWTPTFSGFSTPPTVTGTADWATSGRLCTATLRCVATPGTSNANSFTVTLPFAAQTNAGVQSFMIQVQDNGTFATGRLLTASGSNIATLLPSVTGSTWTTSGSKSCSFTISYIMQA